MKAVKTSKKSLEKNRIIFFEIGMILALSVILFAFEWGKKDIDNIGIEAREVVEVIEEMVPVTKTKIEKPLPKLPATTILNIVPDDQIDIDDNIYINAEGGENVEVPDYVPIPLPEEIVDEPEYFRSVEIMPAFPGGEIARLQYLSQNVKYPQLARETGIQGIVYVEFIVDTDGSITNARIRRGIGGGCDEEALRVVESMPAWSPGIQRTQPVRVLFTMPIKFTLQ